LISRVIKKDDASCGWIQLRPSILFVHVLKIAIQQATLIVIMIVKDCCNYMPFLGLYYNLRNSLPNLVSYLKTLNSGDLVVEI